MLYFIPTPLGNLGDLSFRSLDCLRRCELLLCEDTRSTKKLLSLLASRYEFPLDKKTLIPLHSHNEEAFLAGLDRAIFDRDVGYVCEAGLPGLSDPGLGLVRFAHAHGLAFEVLPGANACLVALLSSGFCEREFVFLGFLPIRTGREAELKRALALPYPAVIYEAPTRILALVEKIAALAPTRPIFAIKEISKKFQKSLRGPAAWVAGELKNANLRGEWVLVISRCEEAGLTGLAGGAGGGLGGARAVLDEADILALDLPPKIKCKLLAKLRGVSAKELYGQILRGGDATGDASGDEADDEAGAGARNEAGGRG